LTAITRTSAAMAVGLGAVILAATPLVQVLVGPGFGGFVAPLILMMLGQVINAACGPVRGVLTLTGHESDSLHALLAAAALGLAVTGALAPSHGAVGAAAGACASMALWNLRLVVLVKRRLGIVAGPLGSRRAPKVSSGLARGDE
jgi:O-antigen/teichoic acid export membrane protein